MISSDLGSRPGFLLAKVYGKLNSFNAIFFVYFILSKCIHFDWELNTFLQKILVENFSHPQMNLMNTILKYSAHSFQNILLVRYFRSYVSDKLVRKISLNINKKM